MAEEENLETQLTSGEEETDELEAQPAEGEEESAQEPSEGEETSEEQPREDATKRWRDEATQTRGQLATMLRTVKALRESGVTEEQIDEAVQKGGLDPAQVRSVLNQEPLPDDPLQANAKRLVQEFAADRPGEVKLALDEAYGEDTQKYFSAYDWLIQNDPSEREALANMDPRKVASYAVRRGKEAYAEYEELKGSGSLLEAFRNLKKRPAETPKPAQPKARVQLGGGAPAPKPQSEAGTVTRTVLG